MATLTLNNIAKRFNGQTIIPGLDLTIHHGEFIALVGRHRSVTWRWSFRTTRSIRT